MGNSNSHKQNTTIHKIRKIASPLSPRRKNRSSHNRNTQNKLSIKFDWLNCYNSTPNDPNPYNLPTEYSFNDFILHHDEELGEGAFAKVILATNKLSKERVAVKVVTKKSIPEEMKDYVVKEAGVLAKFNHDGIVSLKLVHEDTNYIYIFLQFVSGGDLHSRLERDGLLSEDIAKVWFKQMVLSLENTHDNQYCHRDLKLENMLISGEGKKAKILLIDYGFAGFIPNDDHLFDDFPGSFCYAAPELIRGVPYNGKSADIYSLGVILYTLLQSAYPFYSDNKRQMTKMILNEDVKFDSYLSAPARELITWMLMKNPEQRPTVQQIKNHCWIKTPKQQPMSPVLRRIKDTARASLSPVQSRRKARTSVV